MIIVKKIPKVKNEDLSVPETLYLLSHFILAMVCEMGVTTISFWV